MLKEKEQKVTVGALVYQNNKLLIIKRASDEKIFPGKWELPSGQIEFGEDPKDAIKREVKEETGLDAEKIVFFDARNYTFQTNVDKKEILRHNIELVYIVIPKESSLSLSHEHEDFAWVTSKDVSKFDTFKGIPEIIREAEIKLNKS